MTLQILAKHICDRCGFTIKEENDAASYYSDYYYTVPDGWDYGYNVLDDGGPLDLDSKYEMLCENCIEEIKNDKNEST